MKKNRDKEGGSSHSADQLLKKSAAENILVFLALAICLLAASQFPGWRQFFQKNILSAQAETAEQYGWLTGFPELQEGLYLFTPEQMEKNFPGLGSHLAGEGAQKENHPVQGMQYDEGILRPVSLPPAVANIFFQPIPINRANKDILISLPGIGPALAEKIIQRRNAYGPFRSKEQLLHIAGIGPEKYRALVDRITLD